MKIIMQILRQLIDHVGLTLFNLLNVVLCIIALVLSPIIITYNSIYNSRVKYYQTLPPYETKYKFKYKCETACENENLNKIIPVYYAWSQNKSLKTFRDLWNYSFEPEVSDIKRLYYTIKRAFTGRLKGIIENYVVEVQNEC